MTRCCGVRILGTALLLWAVWGTVCEAQSLATPEKVAQVAGLTPDLPRGEQLFVEYCVSCHGRDGWGRQARGSPALAGQNDLYLVEQLIRFASEDRPVRVMHAVVSRAELQQPQGLADVSAYVARLSADPRPGHGGGTQLALGERLYVQSCATCHGGRGEGSRDDLIPAIGGQRYGYLRTRLVRLASSHPGVERQSLQPALVKLLSGLSPAEIRAVSDYASRLSGLGAP